jgi:hypothetical protein
MGNRRANSTKGCTCRHSAFANAHNRPTRASQLLRDRGIAPFVPFYFLLPESPVTPRKILARAPVPEAPIDEYGNLQAWPCEVWPARYRPLLAVPRRPAVQRILPNANSVVRLPFERTEAIIFERISWETWSIRHHRSRINGKNKASDLLRRFGWMAPGGSGAPPGPSPLRAGASVRTLQSRLLP